MPAATHRGELIRGWRPGGEGCRLESQGGHLLFFSSFFLLLKFRDQTRPLRTYGQDECNLDSKDGQSSYGRDLGLEVRLSQDPGRISVQKRTKTVGWYIPR
jgi:hypothetical protein